MIQMKSVSTQVSRHGSRAVSPAYEDSGVSPIFKDRIPNPNLYSKINSLISWVSFFIGVYISYKILSRNL